MREPVFVVDSRSLEALRDELRAVRACLQEAYAELEVLREACAKLEVLCEACAAARPETGLSELLAPIVRWSFLTSSPSDHAAAPL